MAQRYSFLKPVCSINTFQGEEYAYILKNIELYCDEFGMVKLPPKTHPPSIYTEPQGNITLLKFGI